MDSLHRFGQSGLYLPFGLYARFIQINIGSGGQLLSQPLQGSRWNWAVSFKPQTAFSHIGFQSTVGHQLNQKIFGQLGRGVQAHVVQSQMAFLNPQTHKRQRLARRTMVTGRVQRKGQDPGHSRRTMAKFKTGRQA